MDRILKVLGHVNISGHWCPWRMMSYDNNDGQMIFGDLVGLKLPDICLTGEEKPWKNLTQETCPDRGSNPGPLRDRRACCRQPHLFNGCSKRYTVYFDRIILRFLSRNCNYFLSERNSDYFYLVSNTATWEQHLCTAYHTSDHKGLCM